MNETPFFRPSFLNTKPFFFCIMPYSEDEDLLNSDSDEEKQMKSPFSDNSVTAIFSSDGSENEGEEDESEGEEMENQKVKAFSDKDNKWLKLKKNDDDEMEEEEEEDEDEEEEKVFHVFLF